MRAVFPFILILLCHCSDSEKAISPQQLAERNISKFVVNKLMAENVYEPVSFMKLDTTTEYSYLKKQWSNKLDYIAKWKSEIMPKYDGTKSEGTYINKLKAMEREADSLQNTYKAATGIHSVSVVHEYKNNSSNEKFFGTFFLNDSLQVVDYIIL